MGIFFSLLDEFHTFNNDLGDGNRLSVFFEVIQRKYNDEKALPAKLRIKIEKYFDYRWQKDKCAAI